MTKRFSALCLAAVLAAGCSTNSSFFGYKPVTETGSQISNCDFCFSGYTNHWMSTYRHQYRFGNLYKLNVPDLQKCILQTKLNIADDLGLRGLQMQEGFINGLLSAEYNCVEYPTQDEFLNAASRADNLLVFAERDSEAGAGLAALAPKAEDIGSYQRRSRNFNPIDAFILKKGSKTVYAVVGDKERLDMLKAMIATAREVLSNYDMKRGWFGVYTHTQSVTCSPCNQLEAISRGMNEGNSWFVFHGLYEYISQPRTPNTLEEAGCPAVIDFGSSPLYGSDFSELQVQLMFEQSNWEEYKKAHGGYLSGKVPSTVVDEDNSCDFYVVEPGVAKVVNSGTKPFVVTTEELLGDTDRCMVLFNRKGEAFNRENLWKDIMSRSAVAVCGECLMGDDRFRQTLQLLVLDRVYLEKYFGDSIDMVATTKKDNVCLTVTNFYNHKVNCSLTANAPEQISITGQAMQEVSLAPGETKEIVFELTPSPEAMGKRNAVTIKAEWDGLSKTVIANYEMPPAVSVHTLLYGAPSECNFPVSIHNITPSADVDVKLSIAKADKPDEIVFETSRTLQVEKGDYVTTEFNFELPEGKYTVSTEAMGVVAQTQLGIGSGAGRATLREEDLNSDGMNEYIMENDMVRVTLIRIGARAVELYVKDRDDNVFFKLWPENPVDVNRSYRERSFWPFGGFEDFLGQASVETHKIFDAEVIKDAGNFVSVRMTGDLNGNIIEKTYTLYADSPMLEARFALDFINPEMSVLGPQPILSLGKEHWTEDKFYVPTAEGLKCNVMRPERYFGSMFYPTEGWHSGYDTKEDISFVGAFPVERPMYLHMWMNHPSNHDTHFYYTEFQPWVTIEQGVTTYFTYYMWAQGGAWENCIQQMKDRNLITVKHNE